MKAGRNERTSARVARIAGRILESLEGVPDDRTVLYNTNTGTMFRLSVGDLKALAASSLTQAPDRKATTEGKRKAR